MQILILLLPVMFCYVMMGPFWGTIAIMFIVWLNYYSGQDD